MNAQMEFIIVKQMLSVIMLLDHLIVLARLATGEMELIAKVSFNFFLHTVCLHGLIT